MDQERRVAYRWSLVAKSGYCGHRLTPRAGEPIWVSEAFLVDPADPGQGAVDARVEIGTRDLLLASLSAEKPHVVLETPVLLDEEFCFYVTQHGDDSDSDADADSDTDTDTDDGVAVFFRGIMDALSSGDTEGEEDEEDEEAVSSEDDDDEENHEEESEGTNTEDDDDAMSSDYEDTASSGKEEESDGEVGGRAATAAAVFGIFGFVYLMMFVILAVYS